MPDNSGRKLAIVTGASTGIGYHLAECCAEDGFDLVIASDDGRIEDAADAFRDMGAAVTALTADLATLEGVDRLHAAARELGRPVDALLANAGHGLGGGFLDQDFAAARHVIDTNITGTIYLVQKIGREMRDRGEGRILFTGSIAGFLPGSFQLVYNASKAFIDNFALGLREELNGTGVTVTLLMPGPTETEFFDRAGMEDTKVATSSKDDPAMVARTGYKAMMNGQGDVVSGWSNKLQSSIASITPAALVAKQHRKLAEPGTGKR
jgi:uncharacterized protein